MLDKSGKAFFMGVGGSGMSSLAHLLLDYGWEVWGQDKAQSEILNSLVSRGLKTCSNSREILGMDFQFAVYSSAINKSENSFYQFFANSGLPLWHRSELMHKLFSMKKSIAVAGSHGKTSTTAMIASILWKAGLDPAVMVGGEFSLLDGKGGYFGKGEWGVYESDESDGTFLNHSAEIQIVTNIDNDHLDFYKTEENLLSAFLKFLELGSSSKRILCLDDIGVAKVTNRLKDKSSIWAYSSVPYPEISNLALFSISGRMMNFSFQGKTYSFQSPFAGRHYLLNSLGAILSAHAAGVSMETCLEAIQSYRGVKRRLEFLGEVSGVKIYDDYGHHPREIRAVLDSLEQMKEGHSRIIVLFQPHRYTRTRDHYKEFAEVLLYSDICLLLPIYSAGEKPIDGIRTELIYENMGSHKEVEILSGEIETDIRVIKSLIRKGDLLLTIGAGNVRAWGEALSKSF